MHTPRRATSLDDAYRTCNHDKPLEGDDDEWYQDLAAARGDDTLRTLRARLTRRDDGEFVHVAFVSHRGAGKTTELKRLTTDLRTLFHAHYFEANLKLDERHFSTEDLLLSLALSLQEDFEALGRPLPPEVLQRVHGWFTDVLRSTSWAQHMEADLAAKATATVGVPLFVSLAQELKALLKAENTYRTEVREAFRRYPGALLAHVNSLLDAAQARLGEQSLLVLIDNLDRYDPKVVDEVLFQGGRRLRALRCHLIVTPPIALYYRPLTEPLQQSFAPSVMYTVRLRRPDQPHGTFDPRSPGRALLVKALDRRLDVSKLIPDAEALDRLVSLSGGSLRDLLRLVREAVLIAPGSVLDLDTINRAAARFRRDLRDVVNASGFASILGRIMDAHQINDDPKCLDVLYQQLALRYNGEGWYDVHPLVAELPEVRKVYESLRPAQPPPVVTPVHQPATPSAHRIDHIRIEGIGPLPTTQLDISPRWTLLLGDNATGKSTLLRAIALGLSGDADGLSRSAERLLNCSGTPTASIAVMFGGSSYTSTLTSDTRELRVRATRTPTQDGRWLSLGFPAVRGLSQRTLLGPTALESPQPSVADLLPLLEGVADARLDDNRQWIVNTALAAKTDPRADQLLQQWFDLLQAIMPGPSFRYARLDESRWRVMVDTDDGQLPIEQLSQGMISTIGWVGTLLRRLYEAYPHSDAPTKESALVLIDEIDAHLHPAWQRSIVRLVKDHFPNVQVIATSHSPLVAGALDADDKLLRLRRDARGRVEIQEVAERLEHYRADQILTSDAFGLPQTASVQSVARHQTYATLRAKSSHSPEERAHLEALGATLAAETPSSPETPEAREALRLVEQALQTQQARHPEKVLAEAQALLSLLEDKP